jgi:hypothetical protein
MALELVVGKTIVVDVGVLWKASHFKEPINAVAVVYSATEVIGRRLEHTGDDGVRLVRNGSRQDFFGTALADDTTDVEDAFRRVVEASAKAVASAIVPVGVPPPPMPPTDR